MRSTYLPFALPDIDNEELLEIKDSLSTNWITTGPKVNQFEKAFAEIVGASYAIAVNSGTAAMHLSLEASGLTTEDIVVTTPYTFAASAEVIRYFNATPLFVDIDPVTLNLDPQKVLKAIDRLGEKQDNLKAILPVHIGGHPCDLDAIYEISDRYGLAVVEDAAHALPAKYRGRMIGSKKIPKKRLPDTRYQIPEEKQMPDSGSEGEILHLESSIQYPEGKGVEIRNLESGIRHLGSDGGGEGGERRFVCYSFYATKPLTTGEGGMIVTENEELAERCRIMSLHGMSRDAWKRYSEEGDWYYEIVAPGYKYNMTDIAAGMGLVQLKKLDRMYQRRKWIAEKYNQAFGEFAELEAPMSRPEIEHAWHLYILRLNLDQLEINRNQFIDELKKRNIGTSVHFIPLHIHPYYRETYGYKPNDFPVAYQQYQRVISLPIYSKMSDRDVLDVIEAVEDIVVKHRKGKVY